MDCISISKEDVPIYLRSGEFYRSLSDDEDPDQQIAIPSNTLKVDATINNNLDLHHLLSSLRFWGVNSIVDEVIRYCFSELEPLESSCYEILQEFAQDFPYVAALTSVLSTSNDKKAMAAVKSGIMEIVRNFPVRMIVNVGCCAIAAKAGNLDILQYLKENGGELNISVLYAALEGGKGLACVQYLRAQGVEWPSNTLITSLKMGSKECFLYALQDGCTWADHGYYHFLCKDPHVEALKYAIQYGYLANRCSTQAAAMNGAVKCLQVLHQANCPWDTSACQWAARAGHLNCLRYLHENGCPWDSEVVYWAATGNHIECVQYALQQGCPVSLSSCYSAAKKGHLPILKYLHEADVPWDEDTCLAAAAHGHLDCLQYAHEHGAPWDESTFSRTLESGQLECIKYLLEHLCPFDREECQDIVKQGKWSEQAEEVVRFCNYI